MGPDIVLPPGVKITLKKKTEDESDFGIDELSLDDKPVTAQNDGQLVLLLNSESVMVSGRYQSSLGLDGM